MQSPRWLQSLKSLLPTTKSDRRLAIFVLVTCTAVGCINVFVMVWMFRQGYRNLIVLEAIGVYLLNSFYAYFALDVKRVVVYQSRRINLLPELSAVSVVENNPPHRVTGRLYEAHWLCFVLHVTMKSEKTKTYWTTGLHGPHWTLPYNKHKKEVQK